MRLAAAGAADARFIYDVDRVDANSSHGYITSGTFIPANHDLVLRRGRPAGSLLVPLLGLEV